MIVAKAFIAWDVNQNSCTTWQLAMDVLNKVGRHDLRQTLYVIITVEH